MERPPVLIYRFSRVLYKLRLKLFSKVLDYINRLLFSVWIPGSAEIGKNLTLGYLGLGIVIHSNAKIGDDCLIGQNVTIGRNFGEIGVPVLGNLVYIGAGSVIFGEILIDDRAIIGSNSVVNKSVGKDSIVAGSPAKSIGNTDGLSYVDLNVNKR